MKNIINRIRSALNIEKIKPGSMPMPPEILGIEFYIDTSTKFHRSAIFKGWLSHISGKKPYITEIAVSSDNLIAFTWHYIPDMPHLGEHAGGFEIQLLLKEDSFPEDLELRFNIEGIGTIQILWNDIDRRTTMATNGLGHRFREMLKHNGATQMLDIGGRARSGVLRANDYPGMKTEVLDILPGDGVTVVCDAHCMSQVLERDRFDAVLSVSVFEHLIMPWKVAIEMNRVMKTGGIGLIHTHQTIGMHDMPWDFFRFSDSSWKGIFNAHTGFKILGTELGGLSYIIPFFWNTRYRDAEKSAGFEQSAVLIQKISAPVVDWPLAAEQVTTDLYPPGEDYQINNYLKV